MRAGFALLAGLAIGCTPVPKHAAADPAPSATVDAGACTAKGGTIRPVCRMQRPMCVIPYADAGKACRGDADCAGECRALDDAAPGRQAVGVCQATSDPCGCRAEVENGIVQARICVD